MGSSEHLQKVTTTSNDVRSESDTAYEYSDLPSDSGLSKERRSSDDIECVNEGSSSKKSFRTSNIRILDKNCTSRTEEKELIQPNVQTLHQPTVESYPGLGSSHNCCSLLCDTASLKEEKEAGYDSSKPGLSDNENALSRVDKVLSLKRDDAGYSSSEENKEFVQQQSPQNEHEDSFISNSVNSKEPDYVSDQYEIANKSRSEAVIKLKRDDAGYSSSEENRVKYCEHLAIIESHLQIDHSVFHNNLSFIGSSSFILPKDLLTIFQGIHHGLPLERKVPMKPEWLDMDMLKQGQMFAQKYFFCLTYSEMLSLLLLFSFKYMLQPLIYTGNSGTPYTSFKRYLSTVLRVKSWYESDIWDDGSIAHSNLNTVRGMHLNVSKQMNNIVDNKLETKLNPEGPRWCPLNKDLREDFTSSCPPPQFQQCPYNSGQCLFINQMEMSITQFGFVGLAILYPNKFGMGNASDKDLEAFIHLWRVLGYLLGIDDKYNFCNGNLSDVRQRSEHIITYWAKPNLREVGQDWEHMTRCIVEGISYYIPRLTFEVSLKYLCWVIGVHTPRLSSRMTWSQHFMFLVTKMVMCFTLRLPGVLVFHNWLLCRSLKRMQEAPPESLHKLQNKVYDFQSSSN